MALDLNGFSQTLGGLETAGNSVGQEGDVNITGGGTLTVNLASGTNEYQGRITDGSSATSLVKDGAGTLTINNLSGTPSNYTGSTAISGGTLTLAQAELSDDSSVVIAAGAVLNLTHSSTDQVASLTFDEDVKAPGVYNEANSGGFITGSGEIRVGNPAADFSSWAAGFPGFTNTDPTLDFENDGLRTGIEYIVGGNPTLNDGSSLAPTTTKTTSGLEFEFRRTDLANNDSTVSIAVEYGDDLDGWADAIDGQDGVTIAVTENGFAEGVDRVVVSLPSSLVTGDIMFARLKLAFNVD